MEPTPADIQELRDQFLKKLDEDGSSIPGGIHPADLTRIKSNDDWLRRFLLHNDGDIKDSLNMAWDTCKWRKTFGTNDISEQNVRVDYLEDGSMFSHSQDIDGKSLLILKCKKHVKGQRDLEELKRCLVYWFERLERQNKGDMITLFFDMSDTGLSNMDMDYTKYLISLFKMYYPFFLNYILIFEMPWILNTAFKIIKSWLPEKAVKKINFVNKSNLKNFVEPKYSLSCWGGQDSYEFSFVPEDRNGKMERKVHFADPQAESPEKSEIKQGLKVRINPSDFIAFKGEGSELSGNLTLTNEDDKIISYKIKTTSPEKYRVRPCLGLLKPGGTVSVTVAVQSGFQLPVLSRDKFLVMGMTTDSGDKSSQEITDLWKQFGSTATEIKRLRCSSGNSPTDTADTPSRNGTVLGNAPSSPVDKLKLMYDNVSKLVQSNANMEAELRRSRKLLYFLTVAVCLCGMGIAYLVCLLQYLESNEKSCLSPHLSDA